MIQSIIITKDDIDTHSPEWMRLDFITSYGMLYSNDFMQDKKFDWEKSCTPIP